MAEARVHAREARVLIPANSINKLAVMFKGTSFHSAVQQCAVFGIDSLFNVHEESKKEDVALVSKEAKDGGRKEKA